MLTGHVDVDVDVVDQTAIFVNMDATAQRQLDLPIAWKQTF